MIGQICYKVLTQSASPRSIPSGVNIFQDIIPQYPGVNYITKLSITAQPGAKVIINQESNDETTGKEIIIGRTGVYEVEDVKITTLKFARIKLYEYDSVQSQAKIIEGQGIISTAVSDIRTLTDTAGWINSRAVLNQLDADAENLRKGYAIYMQGVNGIYTPLGTDGDLTNVIIDFIYE